MGLLVKSDLQYEDEYSWTAIDGDNPKITGIPDSTLLNREEGYEVLAFINRFAKKYSLKQKDSGLKVESMIHDHLPGDVRSHANVEKWLVENWKKF
ncbi:hypothetical protein ACYBWJ_00820 [Klebsiella pneumoniae]|uniref:hypothetical protein n=1 Tax=Klebsiella pneumoniae TaxID=573 RepID=UPI0012F3536F|nr:hypothetical protein [Klebsiella pneumoniae]EBP5664284.1 hypothetical protein [Salmonella enterica]ELC6388278.1 hypothetical protein [Enterobacter hormaechei]HEJ8005546.1 hypothetical protein [Serratia marcescens]MEB5571708.1 hypothetical protein [Klebsiella pneumoniae]MEB5600998.1 hypothetical protein [Klebsiella pneumoniae]